MKVNIKQYRARDNITQENLANMVGVSRQTINSIERRKYVPSVNLALKISAALKEPVEKLFILEEINHE